MLDAISGYLLVFLNWHSVRQEQLYVYEKQSNLEVNV